MSSGECRSCGEAIEFYRTRSGKWMPINVEADPAGNVRVDYKEGTVDVLSGSELLGARENGTKLRRSHFATCENADDWRKR